MTAFDWFKIVVIAALGVVNAGELWFAGVGVWTVAIVLSVALVGLYAYVHLRRRERAEPPGGWRGADWVFGVFSLVVLAMVPVCEGLAEAREALAAVAAGDCERDSAR